MALLTLDQSAVKELILAVGSFDIDTVNNLLKSDLEIEYIQSSNFSALHIVIELIETGRISNSSLGSARISLKENSKLHVCQSKISLDPLKRPEALRRIVKVLIESGRFNVNALTYSSETVLKLAVGFCRCRQFSTDAYEHLVNAIIELLLKNNANINAKDSSGETPLIRASEQGCTHIVKLLLDWRDEHGAGVDLNARDMYGETALIKAAKRAREDVVELLLQHGCLDEIQDNQGFYALHAVICGYERDYQRVCNKDDFLELIGFLASEELDSYLDPVAVHSSERNALDECWTTNVLNYKIQKTVRMLVTRGRADINAKDFRGNTVLDLALKLKRRINQKTVEMLKECGATSCAVLNKYRKHTFQYHDLLGKTPLHRLFIVLSTKTTDAPFLRELLDFLRHFLNSNPHKEAFEEVTHAKDYRGRTALHYDFIPFVNDVALKSEDIRGMINVLTLKPNIHERDNYGRTPLHYCERLDVYKSLVEQGANEHVQDVYGKTPRDLKQLRDKEHKKRNYYLRRYLEDQQNQEKIDAWIIWKGSEFAYLDQFSMRLSDKVREFMIRLSDEIGKKDPRFQCKPVLIGSAEEGTKLGLPDEFDFNFILTKLSELCEVVPSPEAPIGFVHLKRRYCNAEGLLENENAGSEDEFDEFYKSGILLTAEIASRFRILYLQVLNESEFWKCDDFLEFHPYSEVGMKYDKEERWFSTLFVSGDLDPSDHLCTSIQLKLNCPIGGKYMFTPISLDIVPCIKINDWWPEKTLTSLSDKIKCEGCHLVFDQPQRRYPWVPFSDPFARISFAPAESRIIKECSAVARAAYMVGKQLLYDRPQFTYVLKTCLLYCIEALKDCTNNSLLYEDINPAELRFFVQKLMLCFHEFYVQDFLPCYMMPSFRLPIEDKFKSNQESPPFKSKQLYPSLAYNLYKKVCTTKSPVYIRFPTPEPLNEDFNRERLMMKLSMQRLL